MRNFAGCGWMRAGGALLGGALLALAASSGLGWASAALQWLR